jgi:hypothetical protein
MRNKWPYALVVLLVAALVGCNLPTGGPTSTQSSPGAESTHAAETVAAELTRISLLASPTPNIPTIEITSTPSLTPTPAPTNTPISTATFTAVPCNLAFFVTDVTYKDYTTVPSGHDFTKIWRLRNVGTCTWTSSYKVAFDHGNSMGVSSNYTQSLPGVVPPGQNVDISVDLSAPTTAGTYRGDWSLRDPNNQVITTFIVVIKAIKATTVTLKPLVGWSGAVDSDTMVFPDVLQVGDTSADAVRELFLTFDISGIPSNATITEVKTKFDNYTHHGNPFGHLGVLNGYLDDYGTSLDAGDFVSGFPAGNILDWGKIAVLDLNEASASLKTAVQAKLGTSRFQLRLQFAKTNNDGIADYVEFKHPSLVITYTTP